MCGTTGLVCDCRCPLDFNQRERLYTRAEVEALLQRQVEACAEQVCHYPYDGCQCDVVRATPLVDLEGQP